MHPGPDPSSGNSSSNNRSSSSRPLSLSTLLFGTTRVRVSFHFPTQPAPSQPTLWQRWWGEGIDPSTAAAQAAQQDDNKGKEEALEHWAFGDRWADH